MATTPTFDTLMYTLLFIPNLLFFAFFLLRTRQVYHRSRGREIIFPFFLLFQKHQRNLSLAHITCKLYSCYTKFV